MAQEEEKVTQEENRGVDTADESYKASTEPITRPDTTLVDGSSGDSTHKYPNGQNPKLRYMTPYWWPYRTFVKQRWIGRRLLEVVSTEFRDRSVEYYKHALESGVTKINGQIAGPDYILKDSDRLDNTVHRHEPPVTNNEILVLHRDDEKQFVVISKPGSLPVHATGRYFRHTLLELLKSDFGINAHAVNRLDRLTSGLMILALNGSAARDLALEFSGGKVKKEYVARVKGRFPDGEIIVDKPLLTIDRQMGLVIVAPEGKNAVTIFKRLSYDIKRDQSVVICRPQTGRTHQIRVHLQFLGHPIANDPLYGIQDVWGLNLGRGGIELVPQPRTIFSGGSSAELPGEPSASTGVGESLASRAAKIDLQDRDSMSIEVGSPILLSQQAKDVIRRLRRMKDEQEDWVKWKEVVFTAKAAQDAIEAKEVEVSRNEEVPIISECSTSLSPPVETPPTSRPDPSPASPTIEPSAGDALIPAEEEPVASASTSPRQPQSSNLPEVSPVRPQRTPRIPGEKRPRKKRTKQPLPSPLPDGDFNPLPRPDNLPPGFCQTCFVPLPDDPDPEKLFIYLHALRYTTERLGSWETPLPRWAGEEWDGNWRGWVDDPPDRVNIEASA